MKNRLGLLVIFIMSIIITSCDKEGVNEFGIENECKVSRFTYREWSDTDSIFYSNNKIYLTKHYSGEILESTFRLEYSGNQIISYRSLRSEPEELQSKFIFKNNRISEIRNKDNLLVRSYFYNGDKLDYSVEYYNINGSATIDTTFVTYDAKGENIVKLGYTSFIYDDKINPFRNSIVPWVYLFGSSSINVEYFNANNIIAVRGILGPNGDFSLTYNEKGYPLYLDYFRGSTEGRRYLEYLCD
jgi:hypothetical protein